MAKANWTLTLRCHTDDGDVVSDTTLTQSHEWDSGKTRRLVHENVATDMGTMIRMLIESPDVIGTPDVKEVSDAFDDGLCG